MSTVIPAGGTPADASAVTAAAGGGETVRLVSHDGETFVVLKAVATMSGLVTALTEDGTPFCCLARAPWVASATPRALRSLIFTNHTRALL